MKWYRNPKFVALTPILSVSLLETANAAQLVRMWTERSAEGQSLWGWMCVNLALILWLNFYFTFNKEQKFAIWGTKLGILMNSMVILSVIWFRYVN